MSGCSTKLGCKPGIFVVFSVVFSTCFLGTTPRVKHPIGNENPKWHESGFIEAALEENRDAALADIDGNILARSSQAPFQSRVRTWTDVCHAWAQEPWPITAEKLRMVAASFRRGGYRSVQNYFDSATTYQEHFLGIVVEPLLRKAMRRYTRAVTRGLPGARLKAIFPFDLLAKLAAVLEPAHLEPWSPWNSAHAVDAMILAVWFMLREIEFAAARTQDIDVLGGHRRGDRAHRAAAPVRVLGVGTATVPLPCRPAPRRSA